MHNSYVLISTPMQALSGILQPSINKERKWVWGQGYILMCPSIFFIRTYVLSLHVSII